MHLVTNSVFLIPHRFSDGKRRFYDKMLSEPRPLAITETDDMPNSPKRWTRVKIKKHTPRELGLS